MPLIRALYVFDHYHIYSDQTDLSTNISFQITVQVMSKKNDK